MTTKTDEKKVPRLADEATLLTMLFPEPPAGAKLGEDGRPKHWPTRRTLLYWREAGLLPHVKIRGKKGKVYYLVNDCIEAIEAMTRKKRARKTP